MTTFEWNNQKANANKKKHGISFEEAKSVFTMILLFNSLILKTQTMKNDFSCLVRVIYQGFYWCAIVKKMKVKSFE